VKKRTTIKDIAAELGIHHTTVSRALGNHPNVRSETKQLVLEYAEKLNYHPNILAQSLKSQKTKTIGVIVPEIKHQFFSEVISGIEEVTYESDFVILVCQSNEQYEREVMNAKALLSNKVAGLLVSISQTTFNCDHFKIYKDNGIPLVFFDRINQEFETTTVVVDDYQGAYQAVEHLIKKGRKKIFHIGGTKQLEISQNRYKGYRDALKYYGLNIENSRVVWKGLHEKDGIEGIKELLSDPENLPDAIFAVNDPVALGAYEILKDRGIKIPQDMSVVGFTNNNISKFLNPPLTTVEQPSFKMGRTAAELLIQEINEEKKHRHVVLPTKLIIRSSS